MFLELTMAKAAFLDPLVNAMGWVFNLIFELLSKVGIQNTALCIIIFTVIVRSLMIPLNVKQQKFSRLSSKMNPEIMAVQSKYKGKRDEESLRKQNIEMQAIYEKYGASPTAGCLPMLITFPIIIGLYRVIYNIPAHINYIGNLYENIARAIMSTDGYEETFIDFLKTAKSTAKFSSGDGLSEVITALNTLTTDKWSDLAEAFSGCKNVIIDNSNSIIHVNRFLFGLNITNTPVLKPFPGLVIPALAVITQWYQTRQISATTTSNNDKNKNDNPAMQSMMMMTKIMPIVSGFFCLMLPIGVGIYWIIGSVFAICQQYFVNKHMDNMNIDEVIAKNSEKMKKKKEKLGIDPNMSFAEYAQKNTKSIRDNAYMSNKSNKKSHKNYVNNNSSDYDYNLNGEKKKYKKGSLGDYANLLNPNRDNDESGEN